MLAFLSLIAALAATPSTLAQVLAETPADSLAVPLQKLEQRMGRSQEAGEVAFALGQFHFARGEYRPAAETLARAAARLDPSRKPEARYWQGLALLALQRTTEARVTFEEVARASAIRRADALLGISYAWEQAGRPDRALDALTLLAAASPGETGAAALERIAMFASRLGKPDVARRATDRLRRDYPGSVESARQRGGSEPAVVEGMPVALRIGTFRDESRARSLVEAARRAGFTGAQVTRRKSGNERLYVVRLGSWATREEAERAAVRVEQALGVHAQPEAAR